MGTITTDSGGSITGRFVGEICMLKSATSALNFTYNASRTFARTYLILCPTSASCSPLDRSFSDEWSVSSRCKGCSRLWCQCPDYCPCKCFFDSFILTVRQYLFLYVLVLTVNQSKLYQCSLRHWAKSPRWSRSGWCLHHGCSWPICVGIAQNILTIILGVHNSQWRDDPVTTLWRSVTHQLIETWSLCLALCRYEKFLQF